MGSGGLTLRSPGLPHAQWHAPLSLICLHAMGRAGTCHRQSTAARHLQADCLDPSTILGEKRPPTSGVGVCVSEESPAWHVKAQSQGTGSDTTG